MFPHHRPPFPGGGSGSGDPSQPHPHIDPNLFAAYQLAFLQSMPSPFPQPPLPFHPYQNPNFPIPSPNFPIPSFVPPLPLPLPIPPQPLPPGTLAPAPPERDAAPPQPPPAFAAGPPKGPRERAEVIGRIDRAVENAWRDLVEARESISARGLADAVLKTLQVDSWASLGVQMQQVPSLSRLMLTEGKVNAFIHCFVGVRRITTLYDLELEICRHEGIEKFEELELGPLLRHPLVLHYFAADSAATEVFKITTEEIILELSQFMDNCKKKKIAADEFLNFVAHNRSVKGKGMLAVRIQSLGMHIAFIREAKGSENESLKKCRESLLHKRPLTSTLEMKQHASSLCKRIESFSAINAEFSGKHIRFDCSSSEDEVGNSNKSKDEQTSGFVKPPLKKVINSDRVTSCPYPSENEEISRLGLTGETDGHPSSGSGSSIEEHKKKSLGNKRKTADARGTAALTQPLKLHKGGIDTRQDKSYLATTQCRSDLTSEEDTSITDFTLSYNTMKAFITAWKEACKKHSVLEVFESMLQFYHPASEKKSARRMERIKTFCGSFPLIGLLNVAVASIKSGLWDSIYDTLQCPTQDGGSSPANCPDYEMIDIEPDEEHIQVSEPSAQQQRIEDIILMINECDKFYSKFASNGKPLCESNLACLRKLYRCELWLINKLGVKDFKSLGHGDFLSFLENHSSLLSGQALKVLSCDVSEKPPLEVSIFHQQLSALTSQAIYSIWDGETVSIEMIASLIKRQFPPVCFRVKQNCPLDSFLETVTNFQNNVTNCLSFSAALFKSCPVGDQFTFKVKDGSESSAVPEAISVTSKDAFEILQRAPMLFDLKSWSRWDVVFAPTLGPMVEWLLTEVRSTEMFCLVTQDGNVIKIDQSATADSFLKAALSKSSFYTAVELLSLFTIAGGEKHVPVSLLICHATQAFKLMLKNHLGDLEVQGTKDISMDNIYDSPAAGTWGATLRKNSVKMDEKLVVASRFIIDCLGYLPTEFCSFAADVLLSGIQSVVKHAPLAILSECNDRERIMLHKIGLSAGIEEWIHNFCASVPSNASDLSEASEYQKANKNGKSEFSANTNSLLDKVACAHEQTIQPSSQNSGGSCNVDVPVVSGDVIGSPHISGISDVSDDGAALVIESIRKDEFGLDPNLSHMESVILKKHHARLGRALHCLSQELYSQDSHFLLELVQNADDNTYPQNVEPTLSFILKESGIVVLNNELGFSAQNIRALCDIGNSTKQGGAGYVGQKGIGFKSVFRITDAPEIHSNGFHIKFDISEGEIGFVLPTPVPPCNVDFYSRLLVDTNGLDSSFWRTCIMLPFRSKVSEKAVMEMFLDLHPSLLLFLHRLQCIVFRNMLNDSIMVMRKEILGDGIVNVSCGEDKMTWLVASEKLQGHASRPSVKTTEIAIAFTLEQLADGAYIPCLGQQPVFSFLPLRTYGLKFILQGDFILPSSREEVDKNSAWNQWLLTKFPSLFVSAGKLFCSIPFFRDCPGKAVAAYMSFLPLVGEVHGFFSGLPRAIIIALQRTACLLVEGDNTSMILPCNALRGWNEQARCLLPDGLLKEHLGLQFLDRNIVLSDSVSRALGLVEYGAEILIKFLASICRKEREMELLGFGWLSLWLCELYSMLSHSSGQTDIMEKLRSIPFIPLSDGTYSSVDRGAIWLPSEALGSGSDGVQGLEVFTMLYSKLRTVDPLLLAASAVDGSTTDNKVSMLLKIGIQQLSAHEIMKIHVLPVLCGNGSITVDRALMTEYLSFVMFHLQSSCPTCSSEKKFIMSELQNKALILTNHGYRRPTETAIHFGNEFENPVDVHKLINVEDMEWHEIDAIYLKHPANKLLSNPLTSWRKFLHEVGVTDFVHVFQISRSVSDLSLTFFQKYKDSISPTSLVRDWDSPELVHLLSILSKVGNVECARYLLEVFDILWDDSFSDKATVYCSLQSNCDSTPLKSSFMNHICDSAWVASSMDNKLHYPKDLFYDCDAVRSILGSLAPYALLKVRSHKLLADIGLKTTVDVSDALEILRVLGSSKTPFQASTRQMSKLYSFISENAASEIKFSEAFHLMPFIFMPVNSGLMDEGLVSGVLLTAEEVCWHDSTGSLDLINQAPHHKTGATVSRIKRQLCSIYPGLHDFFVSKCGVYECPPLRNYLYILHQLSNCTSPFQAVKAVFQVLMKWTNALKSGSLSSEDLTYLQKRLRKRKYTVLPSSRHEWVSAHSSFGLVCWCDDKDLSLMCKESNCIHILSFGNLSGEEEDMIRTDAFLILQKLGIPALSEVITREAVYHHECDGRSKILLVHWALPYAQRYIYRQHNEKYSQLKQSEFNDLLELKVVSVARLRYINRIRGGKEISSQRFKCSCLLQDTTLYTESDSDSHALFLELTRLFFSGKPDLHLANFLHMISTMVEAGCSEEQIESFIISSQKVPKLPAEEAVWCLSLGLPSAEMNELPEADEQTTQDDGLLMGDASETAENEQQVSSSKKRARISSDWPPTNWRNAPTVYGAGANGLASPGTVPYTHCSGKIVDTVQISDLDTDWAFEENTPLTIEQHHAETNSVDMDLLPYNIRPPFASVGTENKLHGGDNGGQSAALTGRLGEHLAFKYLIDKFGKESVRWVNEDSESFLPYDMIIGDEESNSEYIEVKATRYRTKEWFNISIKEWQFAVEKGESFSILHVLLGDNGGPGLAGDKNMAKFTTLRDPVNLCLQGKLHLVMVMNRKENYTPDPSSSILVHR